VKFGLIDDVKICVPPYVLAEIVEKLPALAMNEVVNVMPRIKVDCNYVVEAVCSVVFITVVIESG
jgi:hypothetical protein